MKEIVIGIGCLAIFGVGAAAYKLELYKAFAPEWAKVQREVFENSPSMKKGQLQDLQRYYMEYSKEDENGKQVIAATMRHQFAGYDTSELPDHLKKFVDSVMTSTN